jgi:transposase InsO family protein
VAGERDAAEGAAVSTGRVRKAYGSDIAPAWRQHEVARLRALKEAHGGRVPPGELKRTAGRLGLTPKHVRRLVDDPAIGTRRKRGYVADDQALRALAAAGNAVEAHRILKDGGFTMTTRTLQRGLTRAPRPLVSGARSGPQAYMTDKLWLPHKYADRMSLVAMDHKHVPVLLLKDGRYKPHFAWITTLFEVRHRVVLACALTVESPNTEVACATFAEGAAGWYAEDGTYVGGKPAVLLTDNGREFQAEAIAERLAVAGMLREFTVPFGSRMNAELERWHETIEAEFFAQQPGYHGGDKDEKKASRFGRQHPDQFNHWVPFVHRLRAWIRAYNEDRVHGSLGGLTPVASFAADPAPIERVSKEQVRLVMLTKTDATVNPQGIRYDGIDYVAPELGDLVRDTVTIGYLPNSPHYIEVFVEGTWLCTALPSKHLTADQIAKIKAVGVKQSTQVLANEEAARRIRVERAAETDAKLAAEDAAELAAAEDNAEVSEPPVEIDLTDAAAARLAKERAAARAENSRRPGPSRQEESDADAIVRRFLPDEPAPPRLTVVRDGDDAGGENP